MTQLKLSYFDVDGGRGEPIRLALHIAGMTFEDHRFDFSEFEQVRKNTPLAQVPVLTIDGIMITQSNAILRYVGKQAKLYPDDLYQALICDEVMDAAEDCINKIVATFFLSGDELKAARETLVNEGLPPYLHFFADKLHRQGGEYFAAQRLSIADLKIFPIIMWLSSGSLDHVPTDIVAQLAPSLVQHQQRIANEEQILSYYAQRK